MYVQYDSNFEIFVHPMFYIFLHIYLFGEKEDWKKIPQNMNNYFYLC